MSRKNANAVRPRAAPGTTAAFAPADEAMDAVLVTIERRIHRLLARRGESGDADAECVPDRWTQEAPVLAGLAGASVHGRVALGPRAGAEVRRRGSSAELLALASSVRGPCHAHVNGFDLHAGIVVPGRDRARLERTCRYALRPPVAHDRIRLTNEGQVLLALRHRWADGTTHLVFDPIELLERLTALTPRPRINLVLYYGVLGAHAAWRSRLGVPQTPEALQAAPAESDAEGRETGAVATSSTRPRSDFLWAQLMQRSFGCDVLACPRCRGRFRLIALIQDAAVIHRILRHLGVPSEMPVARPSRAPPMPFGAFRHAPEEDLAAP